MNEPELKSIFSALRCHLEAVKYTVCNPEKWKMTDFLINVNKLYYICKGECEITINGQNLHPVAGQMVFIPQNSVVSCHMVEGKELKKFWCHFYSNPRCDINDLFNCEYCVTAKDDEYLKTLFEQLCLTQNALTPIGQAHNQQILTCLLMYYLEQADAQAKTMLPNLKQANISIRAVEDYILNHMWKEITLQDLADLSHLHPNYFSKCFKQIYGISPIQFVHSVKLKKIKELLADTGLPIGTVASKCGFHDIYYFSNFFKKYQGMSPTQYRKLFAIYH